MDSPSAPDVAVPFHALAQTAADAIVLAGDDGHIAYANPAAERMFGYAAGELRGMPLTAIMPDRYREAHRRGLSHHAATGEGRLVGATIEIAGLRKDGTEVPVELSLAACETDGRGYYAGILRDLTDRRRAQESLAKSEALLAQAQQVAGVGSWEWNVDDDVVSWSDELYRIYGLEPQAFAASFDAFAERVHPEDREHVLATIQQSMKTFEPCRFDHRILRPDGEVRYLHCRAECVTADDGRLQRMFGIGQDVTDRERRERALHDTEALFRGAFERAPIGMALTRPDGGWERVNDALCNMLGYTREELTSIGFRDITHPGDVATDLEALRAMLAGERDTHRSQKRYIHADGHAVWVALSVALVRDDAGAPLYFVSQMEDVTERLEIESALRDAEERFRKVFEESPVGIVLTREDFRIVQANTAFRRLTGYSEEELVGQTLADLTHPDDLALGLGLADALFTGSIPSFQVEKRYLTKDGDVIWAALTAAVVRDESGMPLYGIGIVENVSERKRFEGQLQYFADHDPLTGLFNRRRFEEELDRQATYAARYRPGGAVLLMDLDNFKYVNDTLGHRVGDELIKGVADVMRGRLRASDVLARLGGDEFAVVLAEVGREEARETAEALRTAVAGYALQVDGRSVRATASVGVTLMDERDRPADQLIVESDLAMYAAKHAGRNRVTFYEPDGSDHSLIRSGYTWSARVREALENERFVLHAQPIVEIASGDATRHELLIRMVDEHGHLVPPAAFLPTAERFGLIEPLDDWVAGQAIDILAERPQLTLEVNLSGRSIGSEALLDAIERRLADTGADPSRLIFEVTETTAIANMDAAHDFARALRALGCKFALDDFGAGFGSFSYLKHLPVDYLKLDGDFIRGLPESPTDQLLVRAIVDVARGLGQQTIAEFVGSQACYELLADLGVDFAQGFWLGEPRPLPELVAALS